MTDNLSNEEKRAILVSRVEATLDTITPLAIKDNYKTKQETQKRRKCTECGKGYLGQEGSSTCGPTCRKRRNRG